MLDQSCDHCAGPTIFVTEISRLGDEPGHRIFRCDACKRSTWVAVVPRQQVQQQQQRQKKE